MVTHSLDWARWRDRTSARTWLERLRTQGESTWDYARRHPRRATELLILAPFWLGAEAPPPVVLGRPQQSADPGFIDPAGMHVYARSKAIARRIGIGWFAGSVLRGVALALLVLSLWVVLSLIGLVGLPSIAIAIAMIAAGVTAGAVYGWLIWPSPMLVAEMLDRTFHLRERLITAFDQAQDDSRVARLQRADAANALARTERRIARTHYLPIREAAVFLIALGALLALLMTWVPQTGIGAVDTNAVPQFVPASERLAEPDAPLPEQEEAAATETESTAVSISDIQEKGQASESARTGLQRVGEALQSNATTRPAGDSIVNGDYGTASDQLRQSAAAVGAMSQEERDALADEMDLAADDLEATNPELAQQLRETADAVREGGPEAEQAINDLADTIDETASTVDDGEAPAASDVDQGSSSSEGESSQEQGEGQESQQGQGQGEQPAESGEGSDPGKGSDAESGVSENPQEGEQTGEEPGEGSDQGSDSGQGSEGQQSEGSSDQESSQEGEGNGTESDQQSDSQGDNTSDSEEDGSNSGSNSDGQSQSSSDSSTNDAGQAPDDTEAPTAESSQSNEGEANDTPPEGGEGSNDGGTGSESQGSSSLELEGDSEDSVQSGGDSGTSSLGSGSDSTTGNGTGTEADEGVAGPDSNRVPESLRDIVRDYFETEP